MAITHRRLQQDKLHARCFDDVCANRTRLSTLSLQMSRSIGADQIIHAAGLSATTACNASQ